MKARVFWALAVGGAFVLGWLCSPGPYRHFYTTSRRLEVLGSQGTVIGVLPSNTPVVSDVVLGDSPDLGWWGYVPVQFDTMASARELGIQPHQEIRSIAAITLRANDFPGEAQLSSELHHFEHQCQ